MVVKTFLSHPPKMLIYAISLETAESISFHYYYYYYFHQKMPNWFRQSQKKKKKKKSEKYLHVLMREVKN